MLKIHPLAFAALTLPLLLAACGTATSTTLVTPDPVAMTTTTDTALVPISLGAGLDASVSSASLKSQGIPFADDGTPAVQTVRVRVFDAQHQPVLFDDHNAQLATGAHSFIELHPGGGRVTVQLTQGIYFFQAAGLASTAGTPLLAFGALDNQTVGGSATRNLNLLMTTLSGGTEALSLTSLLPVNSVVLGQNLDLMLNVQSPLSGGVRYQVPLTDTDSG